MSKKLKALELWEEYESNVVQRIAQGEVEYAHDPAEKKTTRQLLAEVEEELYDVASWAMFAWAKVQTLRDSLKELELRHRRLSQITPPPPLKNS